MWSKLAQNKLGLIGPRISSSSAPLNPKVNNFQLSLRRVQLPEFFQFPMTELNAGENNTLQTSNLDNVKLTIVACSHSDTTEKSEPLIEELQDEELRKLLVPKLEDLPISPPSAVEFNFVTYLAPGNKLTSNSLKLMLCFVRY